MPDGNQLPLQQFEGNGPFFNTTIPSLRGATLTNSSSAVYTLRWKDGTIYQFQAPINRGVVYLTSITDPNGNVTSITLNPSVPGQITQVTDPVGRSLTLSYDSSNRITAVTDPIGRAVQYKYNAAGYLSTVTDPAGGVTTYGYDSQNRLLSITDPRGVITEQNTYDANNRVIQKTMADGGVYKFLYLLSNDLVPTSPVMLTIVTDPFGQKTRYRFNPNQLLTDVTDPNGQTKTFVLDPEHNSLVTAIMGAAVCPSCGDSTSGDQKFTLDTNGNVRTSTDALGNTTSFTYDPTFNKVTSIKDPLGHVTSFMYDAKGNLLSRTDANSHTTAYEYGPFGLLSAITDPRGQRTTLSYDVFGNLVSTTDALGNTTATAYDPVSRPIETVDALGRRSATIYDNLGRVVTQTNAQNKQTQFAYDANGNLLTVTDAKGHKTSFTYDNLNRLVKRTDPVGKSETGSYDFYNNLIKFVDRRGQISQYTYDVVNRLTKETYADATVTRSYDANGRLLFVNDSVGGAFAFTYDAVGHTKSTTTQFGAVTYRYDSAGMMLSRQVVGQLSLTYAYDPVGNLASAGLPQASVNFVYDERNALTSLARANGVTSQYMYDNDGRLLSITDAAGSTILNAQAYVYDPVGNRGVHTTNIAQPLITQAVSNTYDTANRLLQSTSNSGTTSYAYDENGNLTSASSAAGTTTYTWDARNRLASISESNGQTTSFLYDFNRNLIAQTDAGPVLNRSRHFLLDDRTNLAFISKSDGDSLSVLAGQAIDQHLAVVHANGQVEYGLTDAINSTSATVDQNGKTISSFDYGPYGETTSSGNAYPFQYTGRTRVLGELYYYRARFYSPITGQFLSEDLLNLNRGLSSYTYSGNTPINGGDPSGRLSLYDLIKIVRVAIISGSLYLSPEAYGNFTAGITSAKRGALDTLVKIALNISAETGKDEWERRKAIDEFLSKLEGEGGAVLGLETLSTALDLILLLPQTANDLDEDALVKAICKKGRSGP